MHRIDFSLPSCVAIFLWRRVPFGFHPSSLCCRCIYFNQMWLIVLDSALQRCYFALGQAVPGPMARTIFRMDGSSLGGGGGGNLLKRKMSRSLPLLPPALRTSSSHDRISSRRAVGNDHQAIKGSMEARRRRRPEGRAEAGGGAEAADAAEGWRLAII